MDFKEYISMVTSEEELLSPCAKRSFSNNACHYIDGTEIIKSYRDNWSNDSERLRERTPIQRERDRIIHSESMRKCSERYHTLFYGGNKIVRSYTIHTTRMNQVARSISRSLKLNSDFVEAICMGTKIGASPFIHAAKEKSARFLSRTIESFQSVSCAQVSLNLSKTHRWIDGIQDANVRNSVKKYMPVSDSTPESRLYTSGSQSYWALTTDPFRRLCKPSPFTPELMFGIWQHSRNNDIEFSSFNHEVSMPQSNSDSIRHSKITSQHATFEAIIAQYADDITWAIENISDYNRIIRQSSSNAIFHELARHLSDSIGGNHVSAITKALYDEDVGGVYNYFITDFIVNSREVLSKINDEAIGKIAELNLHKSFGLSEDGEKILDSIILFIQQSIFEEPRVKNRKQLLSSITESCLELLFQELIDVDRMSKTYTFISPKSTAGRFGQNNKNIDLSNDKVHRAQLAVDVFSDMSDQDVFDFLGIQQI